MKASLLCLALLVGLVPEFCLGAGAKMWRCAPPGQRRAAVVLVDRGGGSYVKFGGQRVTAQHSAKDTQQRWSWAANSVVLVDEERAQYFEADVLKAEFKCKRLGGDK